MALKTICIHSVIMLFAAFTLVGCSQPELPLLSEDDVILAFGDSLTAGEGVSLSESYPSVLASLTGLKVVNAGVRGETTVQGLSRFAAEIKRHQPKLVVLLEGGNDVLRNRPEDEIEKNLALMIEYAQSKQVAVLLVGVPAKKLFSDSLPLYKQLAERYQVPLEEDIVADLVVRPSMKSDYVHFNSQGYAALAEAIHHKLIAHGALAD